MHKFFVASRKKPRTLMGCTSSKPLKKRGARAVSITIDLDEIDRQGAELHAPTDKEQAMMAEVINDVKRRRSTSKWGDSDDISFEEFLMYVSQHTGLRTSESELRKLFDFLDLDGNGSVSSAEFVWGLSHSSALRLIARGVGGRSFAAAFQVAEAYDYSKSTQEQYAEKVSPDQEGVPPLTAAFRKARMTADHCYHGVYSMVRQEWQDTVLADICSQGASGGESPWAIFTAGGMGVGKGYTIRFLADRGVFQYSRVVHVDPDHFKACLPEWDGYRAAAGENAGRLCHMESCYLADMAQESSLLKGLHVLIDGSLRDAKWYTQVFATLRARFPTLRIAILYTTADEETVRGRVAERAERTGRDVPEELWRASLTQVEGSVRALGPLADVCATIENPDGAPPRLVSLTAFGADAVPPPAQLHWEHLQERLTGCAPHIPWRHRAALVYADRVKRMHLRRGKQPRLEAQHKSVEFLLHDAGDEERKRALQWAHESHEEDSLCEATAPAPLGRSTNAPSRSLRARVSANLRAGFETKNSRGGTLPADDRMSGVV